MKPTTLEIQKILFFDIVNHIRPWKVASLNIVENLLMDCIEFPETSFSFFGSKTSGFRLSISFLGYTEI